MSSVQSPNLALSNPHETTPVPIPSAVSSHLPLALGDIWRRLWRRKWTVLSIALVVLLLTAYKTFTTPAVYRASATIQIEKEGVQVVKFETLAQGTPDMGGDDPFFRTQYEKLKSRQLAETVIADLDLNTRLFSRPPPFDPIGSTLTGLKRMVSGVFSPNAGAVVATQGEDNTILFLKGLYVEAIENTHLVKIFYESPDPVLSAEIVNGLITAFIKADLGSQSATSAYAKDFLEKELEKARERLTLQEAKWVEYAKQHNILEVNNTQETQQKQLEDMQLALGAAERTRIQAESMMAQGRKHGNVREVLNNPVIEAIKARLTTLEADYQEKLKLFKPAYPDMQRLQQQIEETRRQLGEETARLKQSLQADYAAAQKVESELRSKLQNYQNELVNLRDNSIEYNALKREVETSRNLYDGLLQRMKETNVAANASSNNVKVVDAARPPNETFRPKKSLNLLLGAVTGLLLGIGAALLREGLTQGVASVSELQILSGLPVLGTIPYAKGGLKNRLVMAAVDDIAAPTVEAYRVAAANLRFILPTGVPRATLITSVNPGEGKSTSAANIAFSQAQQGLKVLLLDADLRKPALHTKLGVANGKGLSDYLDGTVEIANVTHAVKAAKGLYFVSAGTCMDDPVSLLSDVAMSRLLQMAMQHFDSIIIDAPPVTGFADTLYLSSLAQATIVVADEERINRSRLLKALEQLRRIKPNVVGFLLLKSQENTPDYRYYGHERRHARVNSAKRRNVPKADGAKGKRGGLNLALTNS